MFAIKLRLMMDFCRDQPSSRVVAMANVMQCCVFIYSLVFLSVFIRIILLERRAAHSVLFCRIVMRFADTKYVTMIVHVACK